MTVVLVPFHVSCFHVHDDDTRFMSEVLALLGSSGEVVAPYTCYGSGAKKAREMIRACCLARLMALLSSRGHRIARDLRQRSFRRSYIALGTGKTVFEESLKSAMRSGAFVLNDFPISPSNRQVSDRCSLGVNGRPLIVVAVTLVDVPHP